MPDLPVSPLAPAGFPQLPSVPGVELGSIAAGIKYKDRNDLLLVKLSDTTRAAGVYTKSKTPAACVDWCQHALAASFGKVSALVVNSGNANAFTGGKGIRACETIAKITANAIGCDMGQVLLASTGVIGEPLPTLPFKRGIPRLAAGLSTALWKDAAKAIMTTDTFPKAATAVAYIDGHSVVINGIAKGSGMVAPDMATMLGFIFTNASITADCLQAILHATNENSFNAITVDGDTSTNDTVLAFATGENAGMGMIGNPSDPRLKDFIEKFQSVMTNMAHQLVRDGEGATKFISITVDGAESNSSARKIGFAIANSPLVKTAIAGEDPNWGRIIMAVGKVGEAANRDAISIQIGEQLVARNGAVHKGYDEAAAIEHMRGQEIDFHVDVGVGNGTATVWTCDLTHGYIDINADYRS